MAFFCSRSLLRSARNTLRATYVCVVGRQCEPRLRPLGRVRLPVPQAYRVVVGGAKVLGLDLVLADAVDVGADAEELGHELAQRLVRGCVGGEDESGAGRQGK